MTNLLLTAAQERAMEEWIRVLANSTNPRDIDLLVEKVNVLVAATWNEAIGAVEGVVPEEKEEVVSSYYEGTNIVDPDTSVLLKEAVGHNACRTETLQALSKLKA